MIFGPFLEISNYKKQNKEVRKEITKKTKNKNLAIRRLKINKSPARELFYSSI